jgi:hypothetical protein
MRKLNQIMLLIMSISLVSFTSCSSDDDNGGGSGSGDEFLTATVDGASYAAAQSPSVIVGAQSVNGVLAVQGGTNNGTTINFAINNYTGVGTYTTGDNITNTDFIQYLSISGTTPSTWASGLSSAAAGGISPGTIEITSDDGTTVEGTFSFDGYNAGDMTTKAIRNGEFKAKFD